MAGMEARIGAVRPVAAACREREVGIGRGSAVDLGMAKDQHGPPHFEVVSCIKDLRRHKAPCEIATDQAAVTRRSQERSQPEQGANQRTIREWEFNDATDRHRQA